MRPAKYKINDNGEMLTLRELSVKYNIKLEKIKARHAEGVRDLEKLICHRIAYPKFTQRHKDNLSKAVSKGKMGKKMSKEQREKISNGKMGKKMPRHHDQKNIKTTVIIKSDNLVNASFKKSDNSYLTGNIQKGRVVSICNDRNGKEQITLKDIFIFTDKPLKNGLYATTQRNYKRNIAHGELCINSKTSNEEVLINIDYLNK
jgi:hypothetical protein